MKRWKNEGKLSFWSCTDCDYSSRRNSDVFKHVERVHLDLDYSCPICPNLYKCKADLRGHFNKVHA